MRSGNSIEMVAARTGAVLVTEPMLSWVSITGRRHDQSKLASLSVGANTVARPAGIALAVRSQGGRACAGMGLGAGRPVS